MNKKRIARIRRSQRTREHIKRLGAEKGTVRLCIGRSAKHIFAQLIAPVGGKVLASASSLEKAIKDAAKGEETKTDLSKLVGKLIAQRAKEAGIDSAASDRSGYKFHGRVAALIQSANEHGLKV